MSDTQEPAVATEPEWGDFSSPKELADHTMKQMMALSAQGKAPWMAANQSPAEWFHDGALDFARHKNWQHALAYARLAGTHQNT